MPSNFEKLIAVSSTAISTEAPYLEGQVTNLSDSISTELNDLLNLRNGFYAFESALHCFPATTSEIATEMTLQQWNSHELWKSEYEEELEHCLFFAEDIFGIQFCIKTDAVFTFDPETGELEKMCDTLNEWAQALMEDYQVLTGFPVAHAWQAKHGKIKANQRLVPKNPFICGGEFTADNVSNIDAVAGMKFRAQIANQVRNLPDGAKIKLVVN